MLLTEIFLVVMEVLHRLIACFRQVKGCPLKVTVTAVCDASRVVCSGDGLGTGTVGKDIRSFIDTRAAGPGMLPQLVSVKRFSLGFTIFSVIQFLVYRGLFLLASNS